MPPPVLTPAQSDQWDTLAEAAGSPRASLMECAGRAAAVVIGARYAAALDRGVLVAAGTGNNGGDGWVLARALHRLGISVWTASVPGTRSPLCDAAAARALAEGVRELPADGPWPAPGLAVDALLGTGARGAPHAPVAALIDRLHDLRVPLVALDGPTGVDLATGLVHGAPRADLSITFGGVRRGHLLARDEVGEVVVVDIGHPPPPVEWPGLVTDDWAARHAPRFQAGFHKGDRGRIVVVGGAPGMSGALRLTARAAFAAGAGYVHAVAPPATTAELRTAEPDVLTLEQAFDAEPSSDMRTLIERADVVVIGPGLGRDDGIHRFVLAAAEGARLVVLDADALTAFQGSVHKLAALGRQVPLVLTPHPGEFRSLLPELASMRELDPWAAAAAGSTALEATLLLKGVPTVVAHAGLASWTVAAGNPGLGTGGSGDILSGIVASMLAHTKDPLLAAALASQALGRGGEIAARRLTARSMRPADVINALPDVWRAWELRRRGSLAPSPPILLDLPAPALD